MITSSSNEKIKWVSQLLKKRKLREEERLFVCEGKKMYFELLLQRPELIKEAFWSQEGIADLTTEAQTTSTT